MMFRLRFLSSVWVLLLLAAAGCYPAPRTAPVPTPAEALRAEIRTIFADTAFAHAFWGVIVRSLDTGETFYQQYGEKMFLPASNMKLVTGAAVLEALGPDFRYRTALAAAGPVREGVLRGDLVVRAGGDPTISGRFTPGDPRAVFRAWADSLRAHGVRRVAGAVVGVDEYFDNVPYGRGWTWDDLIFAYSAPVAGLQFNDAVVQVQVFAGSRAGLPAVVALEPGTGYLPVINRTTTTGPDSPEQLEYRYSETGGALIVAGEVPLGAAPIERNVAVRDPARYFVTVLRESLREAGILVEGPAVLAGDREDDEATLRAASPLFVHHSPAMREILPAFMKPSQNQIAEMLLKTLGRELRGEGSAGAGAQVVDSLFRVWELEPRYLVMADGSGLSRYNYLAPELAMALLERMTRSPHFELWHTSLPIAGVDGTLRTRMVGTPAEGRVYAKTGTLSGVRALSGYVTTADGERLLFSMMVNHHLLRAADADRLIDATLVRLAELRRN